MSVAALVAVTVHVPAPTADSVVPDSEQFAVPALVSCHVMTPPPDPPVAVNDRFCPTTPLVLVTVTGDCSALATVNTAVVVDDEKRVVAAWRAVMTVCPAPMIVTSPVEASTVATFVLVDSQVKAPVDGDVGAVMVNGTSPYVRSADESAPRVGVPRDTVSVALLVAAVCVDVAAWLAVIVVVPGLTTVTRPVVAPTVATEVSLEVHVIGADDVEVGAVTVNAADVVSTAGRVMFPITVEARDTVIVADVDPASSVAVTS